MKQRAVIVMAVALLSLGLLAACGDSGSAADVPTGVGTTTDTEALAALLGQDAGVGAGISVSGQGVAVAEPDLASLSLGVASLASTARAARDDAAARMTDLIASLRDNGVDERDYHTSRFSIDPDIDYRPNGEQVIRGYRVNSTLAVTVRDLDRVGEIIDDAVDAVGDAIRVQGVTFSLDDPGVLLSEARLLAMTDAKAKADELADLAEVSLGKPITISESSGGGTPPVFFDLRAAAEADVSTPISPGQLEVTVNVQVVYEII